MKDGQKGQQERKGDRDRGMRGKEVRKGLEGDTAHHKSWEEGECIEDLGCQFRAKKNESHIE